MQLQKSPCTLGEKNIRNLSWNWYGKMYVISLCLDSCSDEDDTIHVDSDISVKSTEVQIALALLQTELGLSDSQADAVASWAKLHNVFSYKLYHVLGSISGTCMFLWKKRWTGSDMISKPTPEPVKYVTHESTRSPYQRKPSWNRRLSRYSD